MRQNPTLIIVGLCGAIVISLLVLAYMFRDSWAHTTLGGPRAIVKGDPPKHGFLGVDFNAADTASGAPLTIARVIKATGADEAGLQPGDLILAAGPVEQPDLEALRRVLGASTPGEHLPLTIGRGPDTLKVRVKLMSFIDTLLLREQEGEPDGSK